MGVLLWGPHTGRAGLSGWSWVVRTAVPCQAVCWPVSRPHGRWWTQARTKALATKAESAAKAVQSISHVGQSGCIDRGSWGHTEPDRPLFEDAGVDMAALLAHASKIWPDKAQEQ